VSQRLAVVLFNLGGPDRIEAVKPFLLRLFRDPAILRVPFFIRPLLAQLIARRRLPTARANYALLGGGSPLLRLTRDQAQAFEAALAGPDTEVRAFVAMRYWHPLSNETARAVRDWQPDSVLLLPLYPQYSTTTTGSSLTAWREAAARVGLAAPTTSICCYAADAQFASATAAILARAYADAKATISGRAPLKVLFSAHGLPEVIVRAGDPYQFQIERTVAAVLKAWGEQIDWVICFQSRATPQRWIGPSTDDEIRRAAADKVAVLVVPIAFVSEHSETLVELDVEYRHLADQLGVPGYFRVPTQNADPSFIAALVAIARNAIARGPGQHGENACGTAHAQCPRRLYTQPENRLAAVA
jgi:protoporphyrin/coproporphyrin ferrochelatase